MCLESFSIFLKLSSRSFGSLPVPIWSNSAGRACDSVINSSALILSFVSSTVFFLVPCCGQEPGWLTELSGTRTGTPCWLKAAVWSDIVSCVALSPGCVLARSTSPAVIHTGAMTARTETRTCRIVASGLRAGGISHEPGGVTRSRTFYSSANR
jgi:hypothetical protein